MNLDEFNYLWTTQKKDWVLVNTEYGYSIVNKQKKQILAISDEKLDQAVTQKMQDEGCRIYENILDAYSDV